MNSFNCTGRMTTEPELKTTPSGVSVCSFTLAVARPFAKDETDFVNFVAWRQQADYLSRYAHKGSLLSVSGHLTVRKFEDKNGVKKVAYEIVTDNLKIEHTPSDDKRVEAPKPETKSDPNGFEEIPGNDDLPF